MRESVAAEWSEENLTILADAMSHVFLPEGEPATQWIENLREEFFKGGYGDNFAFARNFSKHTLQYKTLDVETLKGHKESIRRSVLKLPKVKMQALNLPPVQNGDYISTVTSFIVKAKGVTEFTFCEKKPSKTVLFSATCKVVLHGTSYEAVGQWLPGMKSAKQDAARAMYEELSKETKFVVPVSKSKRAVPPKTEWKLPEVKKDDYVSAIFLFATKQKGKAVFTPVQDDNANGYKPSSVCQLKVDGQTYEAVGDIATNKALAKQNAARSMYEKLSGIIAESLVLA